MKPRARYLQLRDASGFTRRLGLERGPLEVRGARDSMDAKSN